MKIVELIEEIEPVEWPTDLAWRVKLARYKNIEYFTDFRKNKAFAMPFRNWEKTFYKLTLKDTKKIKYMDTEVVKVSQDTMVADMKYIDMALNHIIKNDPTGSMRRAADPFLQEYEKTMLPYSEFVKNPYVFEKPEILLDRSSMIVLPYKVVTVWDKTNKETVLALKPKRI